MNAEEARFWGMFRLQDDYLSIPHWGMFPVEWQFSALTHKWYLSPR